MAVGPSRFNSDVTKAFSAALTRAEKTGGLWLCVWRDGKASPVTITLPIMGAYSEASPWNCAKSDKIIKNAANAIVERGIAPGIPGIIEALALLATGDSTYLPAVKAYVKGFVAGNESETHMVGYQALLLAEFHLATGDRSVLPSLSTHASLLVARCNGAGIWNKRSLDNMTCALSLILARKCGINSPGINEKIELFADYLRWYVDKGTIPFGDLVPNRNLMASNGSTALAAVVCDLMGDRPAATYFTRLAIASHRQTASRRVADDIRSCGA